LESTDLRRRFWRTIAEGSRTRRRKLRTRSASQHS